MVPGKTGTGAGGRALFLEPLWQVLLAFAISGRLYSFSEYNNAHLERSNKDSEGCQSLLELCLTK